MSPKHIPTLWFYCPPRSFALEPSTHGAAPSLASPPCLRTDAPLPACGAARNTRIISVLHRFIERQTASAYVSTLGGGYFLCDYLGHAQRAALAQLRIAAISGDEKTVGRCLVHLAYSQIKVRFSPSTSSRSRVDPRVRSTPLQLQRYRRAERALKVASGLATRHQDQTLATMVTAARCTIRDLRAYGALPDADPTRDDFVRLRAHTPPKEALQ